MNVDELYHRLEEFESRIDGLLEARSATYCPDFCSGSGLCSYCDIGIEIDEIEDERQRVMQQIKAREKVESSHEQ